MVYFLIALVLSLGIVPLVIWLSIRYEWFDHFDERKIHTTNVPRLGGIGIAVSWFIVAIIWFMFQGSTQLSAESFWLFLAGAAGIFAIGLVDDFRNLPASLKLLVQIASAVLICLSGFNLNSFWIPCTNWYLDIGFLGPFLMVFWIISITNAINLIDGMDWLAGSISLIVTIAIAGMHAVNANGSGLVLSLILAGAIGGFLVFNRPKAKIFMGDSGAYFLGVVLATLPFIPPASSNVSSTYNLLHTLRLNQMPAFTLGTPLNPDAFIVILALIIPVGDMLAAILRRYRRRLPFHSPDREHVHHKMLDFGLSVPKILLIIIPVSLLFGGLSVLVFQLAKTGNVILAGILELAGFTLAIVLFTFLHKKNKRRQEKLG